MHDRILGRGLGTHNHGKRHCTDYDPCRPSAWGKEQRCERDFMKHTGPMRHYALAPVFA